MCLRGVCQRTWLTVCICKRSACPPGPCLLRRGHPPCSRGGNATRLRHVKSADTPCARPQKDKAVGTRPRREGQPQRWTLRRTSRGRRRCATGSSQRRRRASVRADVDPSAPRRARDGQWCLRRIVRLFSRRRGHGHQLLVRTNAHGCQTDTPVRCYDTRDRPEDRSEPEFRRTPPWAGAHKQKCF